MQLPDWPSKNIYFEADSTFPVKRNFPNTPSWERKNIHFAAAFIETDNFACYCNSSKWRKPQNSYSFQRFPKPAKTLELIDVIWFRWRSLCSKAKPQKTLISLEWYQAVLAVILDPTVHLWFNDINFDFKSIQQAISSRKLGGQHLTVDEVLLSWKR